MWCFFFYLIALFFDIASLAKLKTDANAKGWRDPPLTRGLLYPFESESRDTRSLDGMWRFLKVQPNDTNRGLKEKWFMHDLDKKMPTLAMPVPASYNDLTTDEDLRDHVGDVWYQRKFFVSHDWSRGKRVWLRFGSVHYSAIVWINDKEVVRHAIGHLPFETEITGSLKFGRENHITVLCDNTLTRSTVPQGELMKLHTDYGNKTIQTYTFDFFNYAGIHRSVVLYTTPKVFIQDINIVTDVKWQQQQMPEVTDSPENDAGENVAQTMGVVNYTVLLAGLNSPETSDLYYLHLQLRDTDGVVVANDMQREVLYNGSMVVQDPKLWWPYLMDPVYGHLYTLEVYLHATANNSLIDAYRMRIGIRKFEWDNENLLINGKKAYLHGFGRHEDSELRGKGLDFALLTRDFNLLKWIGANAYRTSHYPYSEESMQFADENGIIIIDECSSVNTDHFGADLLYNHKSALEQLIHRDRNHPSVLMWSIANEARSFKNQSEPYFKEIVRYVKSLDTSRPITAAVNVDIGKDKLAQFLDIISFNRYNAWYQNAGHLDTISIAVKEEATKWHTKYDVPILMSEYGADTLEGFHSLPNTIWSEDYQIGLFREHFKAFDYLIQQKWFIGEFVWNFADFKTEQTYTRVGGNKKGVFTRNRQPKSSAYVLRERYFGLSNQFYNCEIPNDLASYTINWRYRAQNPARDDGNCDGTWPKQYLDFNVR